MKTIQSSITAVLVVLLAGCGGGGGSSGSASSVAPSAALNGSNQAVAAQDTMGTAFSPVVAGSVLNGVQAVDESVLFSVARSQLGKLPAYLASAAANPVLTGAISSQTVACSLSGSVTVSAVDADNNGVISGGDSVSIAASNCVEAEGTLNGTLGFAINSLSGPFGTAPYSLVATMNFNNFTVTSGLFSATGNGSLTLAASVNGVKSSSRTVSTPYLNMSGLYAGVSRTRILTNYSATATTSPDASSTYIESFSFSGSVTSSALSSQTIAFATTTPFVARGTEAYPSSGVLVISGASNSRLKLTALSSVQVREELDANGDGSYESSTTVNWNTLM